MSEPESGSTESELPGDSLERIILLTNAGNAGARDQSGSYLFHSMERTVQLGLAEEMYGKNHFPYLSDLTSGGG